MQLEVCLNFSSCFTFSFIPHYLFQETTQNHTSEVIYDLKRICNFGRGISIRKSVDLNWFSCFFLFPLSLFCSSDFFFSFSAFLNQFLLFLSLQFFLLLLLLCYILFILLCLFVSASSFSFSARTWGWNTSWPKSQ